MTLFDDRESAFENKFAHEAEMEFKAEAMRNRMIAYWASELLDRDATFAASYAKDIIRVDFQHAGIEDVVAKLVADLGDKSDEATIRAKLQEFLNVARERVRDGRA